MPTLTINIADKGTIRDNGRPSRTGHIWYSLNDDNGNTDSYGFAQTKEHEGEFAAPGNVWKDDSEKYISPYAYTKTIEITQEQYNAMKAFGDKPESFGFSKDYNVLTNSCIDFVWKALEKGGLNPIAFEGMIYPILNKNMIDDALSRKWGTAFGNCSTPFTSATTVRFFDPLILDLDNDGVETTNVKDGAYFDHDGNGFAEQTGWAGSDDGLLVMDKNGDGVIDSGAELFGDQTILQNGQKATDGFQALAELDTNSDGVIDINDTQFSQLKVWQDIDGDGYSSSDELFTLQEMGIASINVAHTDTNTVDPNGNTQVQQGSFTKTDNTTGEIGGFNLRRDATYTIANDWLDVPDDIAALPDLQGYGNTYDLHQAMVRDATRQLKTLIEQFMAADDSTVRDTLMEQILFKWTGADAIDPDSRGTNFDARQLAVIEKLLGQPFVGANGPNPNNLALLLLVQAYKKNFNHYKPREIK